MIDASVHDHFLIQYEVDITLRRSHDALRCVRLITKNSVAYRY